MKNLKKFIKESLDDMLTFKDGLYPRENVSESDKSEALEIIRNKLSFKYSYSATHADGIIITFSDGKEYLITYDKEVIPYKY